MAFPVVAFAASAGGLEALFELLPGLDPRMQAAYVVIQHLDRDHKSLLAELLGKKTDLPVVQVYDGLEVRPANLYVIPPNASLTLSNERFHLKVRDLSQTPHHPADIFLNSLAEERGDAAIGVILSGGDSDGALGIQAVKHAGGITFAQDHDSARFPSMPRSAIDTGCIDTILSPLGIAQEISRLIQSTYLSAPPAADEPVEETISAPESSRNDEHLYEQVFRQLRNAYGVDFQHYKRSTLERRLARRMALHKTDTLVEYLSVLGEDSAEAAALYQDFLIRVTSFFRDAESFTALRSRVFPNICEGRPPREPIRIWVPGCATGEEVYSLAISLVEFLGERAHGMRIQIFGTDVSEIAIDKARAGIYLENIVEDVSSERLERFFLKVDGHYQISKRLRELCIFARHDVTRDPPFSRLDVVSCRNLLIYLDATAQRRVMQTFHYALRPHGFLMLGPSESIGNSSVYFELVDKFHRMYTRRSATSTAPNPTIEDRGGLPPSEAPANNDLGAFSETDAIEREADRFLLSRYAPASVLVDDTLNIVQFRGETSPYLEHASGAASLNLHRVLRPELLVEISPAIQEVRDKGIPATREGLRVGELSEVKVEVVPFRASGDEYYYLILLEDAAHSGEVRSARPEAVWILPESDKDRRLVQLERELSATREYLQLTVEKQEIIKEELKSAHEEVLSANEEFQSTNEELETAKEELQSSNEELTTTNEELRGRNRELSVLNGEVQATRATAERAQQYADAIIESVREPLIVLNAELKVLRANRSYYRDLRTRREQTEGRLLRDLEDHQWDGELLDKLDSVLTRNAPLDNFELVYRLAPDTPVRKFVLSARKIPGDSEREQLILLSMEDVTDRDADAHLLREADRRKDEFLAMLAHELRNPLTPITHAIQLLKRSSDGTAAASSLYQMIERQTNRLTRLVEELVDTARISRGHIELKKQTVDFAMVAGQAAEAARARLEQRRHELAITLPSKAVLVEGDAVRLEQIVANLLENAAKYTEPGGRIELKVTQGRTDALLSVRDNGIGLAQENLASIFNLFTQVDSSLARSSGGLGIGLTLVRRVVELHGGRIEARSAGLGHGSEFIVQIPLSQLVESPANGEEDSSLKVAPRNGSTYRVLIVDDNVDAAQMIALLARHWGHEVVLAHDGPSALELAQSFRPDHALVDIGLPGMNGYELASQLRDHYPELNLVAMTGYGKKEDRNAAFAAGFHTHLVKPSDLDVLEKLLAAPRAGEAVRTAFPQTKQ